MTTPAVVGNGRTPMGRACRAVDLIASLGVVLSVGFLVWRTATLDSPDLIPTGVAADLCFVAVGVMLIAALWRGSRPPTAGVRVVVWSMGLILAGMAGTRFILLRNERYVQQHWKPVDATLPVTESPELIPLDAAEWTLRIALHAASDSTAALTPPMIPSPWPVPMRTTIALRQLADGDRELWTRTEGTGGAVVCHARVSLGSEGVSGKELTPQCGTTAAVPAGVVFASIVRGELAAPTRPATSATTPWLQHRGNANRDAVMTDSDSSATGWRTTTHTPVRASVSVAGDLVLIGGHGSGLLVALDRASGVRRWVARAPNWIHQDAVTDGRIVVVGFGDNKRSFVGQAPNGVAAFNLATGQRIWTEFEARSVMTSPIIHDSVLIYVSSGGVLRKRRLDTGALLGTLQLPGAVIMGPPVRTGDTLIATLDGSRACAVNLATLRSIWCHSLDDQRMLGHSSAAINDGSVVVSGVATAITPGAATFVTLPVKLQLQLLRTLLFPQYLDYRFVIFAGQVFTGLDLATGTMRWRSQFFVRRHRVDGHTSGTAAMRNGLGVIVLPLADTVVAFDTGTGATRWTAGAHGARGAPLLLGQQVVVAGRNGVIDLRQLQDGALACTLRRKVGYDRAGPVVSGGLVIFANLDGEVEAIPARELLDCTATGAVRPGIAQ